MYQGTYHEYTIMNGWAGSFVRMSWDVDDKVIYYHRDGMKPFGIPRARAARILVEARTHKHSTVVRWS